MKRKQRGKAVNVYYLDGTLLFSGSKTEVGKRFNISLSTVSSYIRRKSFYSHRYYFSEGGFEEPKNNMLNNTKGSSLRKICGGAQKDIDSKYRNCLNYELLIDDLYD